MKKMMMLAMALGLSLSATFAEAKSARSGALVGAVVGAIAGNGDLGAIAAGAIGGAIIGDIVDHLDGHERVLCRQSEYYVHSQGGRYDWQGSHHRGYSERIRYGTRYVTSQTQNCSYYRSTVIDTYGRTSSSENVACQTVTTGQWVLVPQEYHHTIQWH